MKIVSLTKKVISECTIYNCAYFHSYQLILRHYPARSFPRIVAKYFLLFLHLTQLIRLFSARSLHIGLVKLIHSRLISTSSLSTILLSYNFASNQRSYAYTYSANDLQAFIKISSSKSAIERQVHEINVLNSLSQLNAMDKIWIPHHHSSFTHDESLVAIFSPLPENFIIHKKNLDFLDSGFFKSIKDIGENSFCSLKNLVKDDKYLDPSIFSSHIVRDSVQQFYPNLQIHTCFAHGDLASENIFCKPIHNSFVYALVDWEHSSFKSPASLDPLMYTLGFYHKNIIYETDPSKLNNLLTHILALISARGYAFENIITSLIYAHIQGLNLATKLLFF